MFSRFINVASVVNFNVIKVTDVIDFNVVASVICFIFIGYVVVILKRQKGAILIESNFDCF